MSQNNICLNCKVQQGILIFYPAQESRYTFTHYYGNRREDGVNHVHRDFAQEGGFLCPSGNFGIKMTMIFKPVLK